MRKLLCLIGLHDWVKVDAEYVNGKTVNCFVCGNCPTVLDYIRPYKDKVANAKKIYERAKIAEGWIDDAEEAINSHRARQPRQEQVSTHAIKRAYEVPAREINGYSPEESAVFSAALQELDMATTITECQDFIAAMASEGFKLVPVEPSVCNWENDDIDNKWDSGCGKAFIFLEGGPVENEYKYCPECGKLISVIEPEQPLVDKRQD